MGEREEGRIVELEEGGDCDAVIEKTWKEHDRKCNKLNQAPVLRKTGWVRKPNRDWLYECECGLMKWARWADTAQADDRLWCCTIEPGMERWMFLAGRNGQPITRMVWPKTRDTTGSVGEVQGREEEAQR